MKLTMKQWIDALGTDEVKRRLKVLASERRHSDPRMGYYFPRSANLWRARLRDRADARVAERFTRAPVPHTTAEYVATFCKLNHLTTEGVK